MVIPLGQPGGWCRGGVNKSSNNSNHLRLSKPNHRRRRGFLLKQNQRRMTFLINLRAMFE